MQMVSLILLAIASLSVIWCGSLRDTVRRKRDERGLDIDDTWSIDEIRSIDAGLAKRYAFAKTLARASGLAFLLSFAVQMIMEMLGAAPP